MQGSSFAVHECRHISIITAISGAGRPRAALELLDVSLGFAWEDDRCLISPYLISLFCGEAKASRAKIAAQRLPFKLSLLLEELTFMKKEATY